MFPQVLRGSILERWTSALRRPEKFGTQETEGSESEPPSLRLGDLLENLYIRLRAPPPGEAPKPLADAHLLAASPQLRADVHYAPVVPSCGPVGRVADVAIGDVDLVRA